MPPFKRIEVHTPVSVPSDPTFSPIGVLRALTADLLRAVADTIHHRRPRMLSELTNVDLEALEVGRKHLRRQHLRSQKRR